MLHYRTNNLSLLTPVFGIGLLLIAMVISGKAFSQQFKSKLFLDTETSLGQASSQSVAALKQQFSQYEDAFQLATTGQFLARKLVQQKQYDEAVFYYQQALAANSLDAVVENQLRLELAQVLFHLKRHVDVLALYPDNLTESQPLDVPIRLLLARAAGALQNSESVKTLIAPLLSQLPTLTEAQLQQLQALAFHNKQLKQVLSINAELLQRQPDYLDYHAQRVALYIQQNHYAQALQQWALAAQMRLHFSDQDWLLLAELYAIEKFPDKAARVLNSALENQQVQNNHELQHRLFEYWYQAKEWQKAQEHLRQRLQLQPDWQWFITLLELQQQQADWSGMLGSLEMACKQIVPDHHVGKVNLLLGLAYFKLEQTPKARRAWLNASLMGTHKGQARQWLAFMQAAPASDKEQRRLQGLCLPADPVVKLPKVKRAKQKPETPPVKLSPEPALNTAEVETAPKQQPQLVTKVLPKQRVYSVKMTTTSANLAADLQRQTTALVKNLIKTGGQIKGPMTLVFDGLPESGQLRFVVAFPYAGSPVNTGRYRRINLAKNTVVSIGFKGDATELPAQWQWLVATAISQGHRPTGHARMVVLSDTGQPGIIDVELQLAITD